MIWNFKKISDSEYERIKTALRGHDQSTIILIHDRYEVSKIQMCCCENSLKTELYEEIEFWFNNLRD